MSKYRFKDTVEAKPRMKTGANVEIITHQFDVAMLLAKTGIDRGQLSDKSLLSLRVDVVFEIDVETRMICGVNLVRSDQEFSTDQLFVSAQ
ncbi:hypothetical protein [Celeribacter sp. SCSIO 80788]|uniref:hypothetical protein n=1 Tax=Celeribacter sp. SCSIO 80788 TaxID=3117013 RepID=UPI003DA3E0BE